MFRYKFQCGFLSILYGSGSKPLLIWRSSSQNGFVRRITDEHLNSLVMDLGGANPSTTYITCPADPRDVLAVHLPFLTLLVKNMKKLFLFEIEVLDSTNVRRRFKASNFQSYTDLNFFSCTMPMCMEEGWNQVQFNLADFVQKAYKTRYVETLRVTIHANCRIRRVFFTDRVYAENETPAGFRLFRPTKDG
ncbi:CFAP20 [Cordylochernes scorpioides]|uniref:CFAP20 n=1 Tax=Cordylochernes scorpioides TaxID=51811 RepID=A0ABY6LD48_9ARAC|nr:CFAP20 [Cordylochernes scorpioides]UYV78138.1 CFAP20 [Cordylochernes scorpioides]